MLLTGANRPVQRDQLFRKEFSKLENLRSLVGLSVPLFACSATLNPKTLEDVMRSLVLRDHNTEIIRTALTRKELAFRLGTIPRKTIESYTSLRFLVDAAIEPPINKEIKSTLTSQIWKAIPQRLKIYQKLLFSSILGKTPLTHKLRWSTIYVAYTQYILRRKPEP